MVDATSGATASDRAPGATADAVPAGLLDDERITVVGLFLESHAALVRRLDAHLRAETGMALATFEVLVRLGRSPLGRLRLTELGRQLSITTGGVTRLIDRIEAAGLLRRVPDPADRRAAFAQITEDGRDALERATEVHLGALQRYVVDPLEPGAYRSFGEAVRVLRDDLVGDPATRARPDRRPAP